MVAAQHEDESGPREAGNLLRTCLRHTHGFIHCRSTEGVEAQLGVPPVGSQFRHPPAIPLR